MLVYSDFKKWRFFLFVLVSGVILSLAAFSLAEEVSTEQPELWDYGGCGTEAGWELYSDGTLKITGQGSMLDYTGSAGQDWYRFRNDISSVQIGNGITHIGSYAFQFCEMLSSVSIPESVESIGAYAFANTGTLKSVSVPDSVTVLGSHVFSSSGLTSVTIPNALQMIPDHCFAYCTDLTGIHFPTQLKTIGEAAFSCCESLEEIVLPDTLISLGSSSFESCTGLTAVHFPDGLISIPYGSFSGCSLLSEIQFPSQLEAIGEEAFSICESLASIGLYGSGSLREIGSRAFGGCISLQNISLPSGLTRFALHNDAFSDIAGSPRFSCSYGSDTSETLGALGWNSFSDPEFPMYHFTGGIPEVVDSSLVVYSLPDALEVIPENLFSGCGNMRWVILSSEISAIPENAFPDSLEEIFAPADSYAAEWAQEEAHFYPTYDPALGNQILIAEPEATISLLETYDLADRFRAEPAWLWSDTPILLSLEGSGTLSGSAVTPSAPGILTVTASLKDSQEIHSVLTITVTDYPISIMEPAFSLQPGDSFELHVMDPDGVPLPQEDLTWTVSDDTVIRLAGSQAAVSGFGSVRISVSYLEKVNAVMDLWVLQRFMLPEDLRQIEAGAFENSDVQCVYIPENCEFIDDYAFRNCRSLREVYFLSDTVQISSEAFAGCENLRFCGREGSSAQAYSLSHEEVSWRTDSSANP